MSTADRGEGERQGWAPRIVRERAAGEGAGVTIRQALVQFRCEVT